MWKHTTHRMKEYKRKRRKVKGLVYKNIHKIKENDR